MTCFDGLVVFGFNYLLLFNYYYIIMAKSTAKGSNSKNMRGNSWSGNTTPSVRNKQRIGSFDKLFDFDVAPDGTVSPAFRAQQQLIKDAIKTGATQMLPPRARAVANMAYAANQMLPPGRRVGDAIAFTAKNTPGVSSLPAFRNLPKDPLYSGQPGQASYGLSKAPNPKPVHLNSTVMPNAYSNDYMTPMLNACSPMHVNNVSLQIPSAAPDPLYQYFLNTIAFDIQTRAQSNVTFNLDITNVLTTANILTAFNSAIKALQIYFFYSSILSYESDSRNKNPAMIALRNMMTPQLISDLTVLGRRLEDTPVPPRLVEYIRYLNMNFLSGDTQGSPIVKFGFDWDCLIKVDAITYAATALTALTSGNNNAVFALIRRAIPKWRIGTLYDIPITPVYDKNFLTIFANSPQQYGDSNTTPVYRLTPTVSLATDSIAYNTYNNRLDGAAYASMGVYMASTWYGLLKPMTNGLNQRSRTSYYTNGSVIGWYGSDLYSFLTASREETYQVQYPNTTQPLPVHLFGTDRLQGVSLNAIQQTQQNFLDFLFDVNSIPVIGKLSSFNNNGANKI